MLRFASKNKRISREQAKVTSERRGPSGIYDISSRNEEQTMSPRPEREEEREGGTTACEIAGPPVCMCRPETGEKKLTEERKRGFLSRGNRQEEVN